MITNEKADCFLMGASQAMVYDNNRDFKSVPLTKTMEACFAVKGGEGTLLSIPVSYTHLDVYKRQGYEPD